MLFNGLILETVLELKKPLKARRLAREKLKFVTSKILHKTKSKKFVASKSTPKISAYISNINPKILILFNSLILKTVFLPLKKPLKAPKNIDVI